MRSLPAIAGIVIAACGTSRGPPPRAPAPIVASAPAETRPTVSTRDLGPERRRCEQTEADYRYSGDHEQRIVELDEHGRLMRYEQTTTRQHGSNSHKKLVYEWTDAGSLARVQEYDDALGSFDEPMQVILFSHGEHGEIVKQEQTGRLGNRDIAWEWRGHFRPSDGRRVPNQPRDLPPVYGFEPLDLVARTVSATMPPFVFEGHLILKSDGYGMQSDMEFDVHGRCVHWVSYLGKFEDRFTYGPFGVNEIRRVDGRVTKFEYRDSRLVRLSSSTPGEPDDVASYDYDSEGYPSGLTWHKEGRADIVERINACTKSAERTTSGKRDSEAR